MGKIGIRRVAVPVALAAFLSIVFVPAFSSLGGSKVIFVDDSASGSEKGTWSSPYHSIGEALEHAKDGYEVRVKKGKYRENITIPNGVKVVGDTGDRGDVVIDGDRHDDEATVTMRNNSKLSSVTVKNGKYGIKAREDAKVHVYDVMVESAGLDGIRLDEAPRWETRRAYLEKVTVKESGKAGVYARSRFVVIVKSEIKWNGGNGLDFEPNVRAWVEDTKIRENRGSGWKLVLDGSEIWTDDNDFRGNAREGVQVESWGAAGKFGLKDSKEVANGNYGVALIARTQSARAMWKQVFIEGNSAFDNQRGQVSPVMFIP